MAKQPARRLINAKFQPRANLPTGKSIKTTAAFIRTRSARVGVVNPILREANLFSNRRFKVAENSTDLIPEPLCQRASFHAGRLPKRNSPQRSRSKAVNKLKTLKRSPPHILLRRYKPCVMRICHVILELHSRATTALLLSQRM